MRCGVGHCPAMSRGLTAALALSALPGSPLPVTQDPGPAAPWWSSSEGGILSTVASTVTCTRRPHHQDVIVTPGLLVDFQPVLRCRFALLCSNWPLDELRAQPTAEGLAVPLVRVTCALHYVALMLS